MTKNVTDILFYFFFKYIKRNCIEEHANLASVHNELENNFLIGLLPSTTTRCWLGVQDAEGQWLWSDGTPYDYSNWCSNEPNNLNVENCGEINWTDRCWNDASCSTSMGYVCFLNFSLQNILNLNLLILRHSLNQ
uniref:C-type lectin domain-containing protein n=1 Tax=Cyprinus carpio TaxID=7962 RepID=A0A8C1NMA5_CYPCA